jgi:hypothetical protein
MGTGIKIGFTATGVFAFFAVLDWLTGSSSAWIVADLGLCVAAAAITLRQILRSL